MTNLDKVKLQKRKVFRASNKLNYRNKKKRIKTNYKNKNKQQKANCENEEKREKLNDEKNSIESKSKYKEEEKTLELKVSINNICGNKNDIKFTPGEISISATELEDLNKDSIKEIIDTLDNLSQETLNKITDIKIPIYIFNINNILISGKKNETNFK